MHIFQFQAKKADNQNNNQFQKVSFLFGEISQAPHFVSASGF